MVKNVEKSVVDNAMNLGGVDSDSSKEKRSQDGNPLAVLLTEKTQKFLKFLSVCKRSSIFVQQIK